MIKPWIHPVSSFPLVTPGMLFLGCSPEMLSSGSEIYRKQIVQIQKSIWMWEGIRIAESIEM